MNMVNSMNGFQEEEEEGEEREVLGIYLHILLLNLKGVFAKNEKGYRPTSK